MNLTIARIGTDNTIRFAAKELETYLRRMDPTIFIDHRIYPAYRKDLTGILWLGLDGSVAASETDEILIELQNGSGIITGSGNRAVLIAVYRLLRELGCYFLHPGTTGEIIPSRKLQKTDLTVSLQEKASYKHRSVCIEGAVSYEHVYNMIDWLPKVGMSGYFVQFHTPSTFFKRFYNDPHHTVESVAPITDEDVTHLWESLEEEIILRGLDYHATGHGWTCEPFGIHGTGWEANEEALSDSIKANLALVNGKRELWGNVALNTNLCYSNPTVRDTITNAIVTYSKEHPAVNYLHFWLADGSNNHCECEECSKKLPSDYYVMMLNELDQKLTAANVDTKIVCLIYVDLLWAPEFEKVKNPDRFVLMFAPITRTYTSALTDGDLSGSVELAPYTRNRLIMPKSVAENVARLSRWQKEQLSGDSFDFDYHLMWDHHLDLGYYECARILHKDMCQLEKIGLNGMVSCQLQRAAFPTGLPLYAMARGLWDKTSCFEKVCEEYFTAAFGENGKQVKEYMASLSVLSDPVYLRGEKPLNPVQIDTNCARIRQLVADFSTNYLQEPATSYPMLYLHYHAQFCLKYADVLEAYLGTAASADKQEASKEALLSYTWEMEPDTHPVFDPLIYKRIFSSKLEKLLN